MFQPLLRRRTTLLALTLAAALLVGVGGAQADPNRSLHVDAGEVVDRGLSSVNGTIRVDDRADLRGDVSTVNGRITVGSDCRTRDLSTVNGSLSVGRDSVVDGAVETVNGTLRIEGGTRVGGHVGSVNGTIELLGATVERDVETVNGHIQLDEGAIVEGSIIIADVENRGRTWGREKPLEIELRGGSRVKGNVENRDDERQVVVVLRDGSAVEGEILGATVERR